MTVPNNGNEENKEDSPAHSPELNEDGSPKAPVEEAEDESQDVDHEKAVKDLEDNKGAPPEEDTSDDDRAKELKQATYTLNSTIKRIKDLGGDPSVILADDEGDENPPTPPAKKPVEKKEEYVTKLDLARTEAEKLARSPGELKHIMWYVENKGLSVLDAHTLANKGKIAKAAKEVARADRVVPAKAGSGAGQAQREVKIIKMPESQDKKLQAAGLVFDQATNSYVGKRTRCRHNGTAWVHERKVGTGWVEIPDAGQFDN